MTEQSEEGRLRRTIAEQWERLEHSRKAREAAEAEVERWMEHTQARDAALSRIARQHDELSAEVERLTAQLDAAREAWDKRDAYENGTTWVTGLPDDAVAAMNKALAGDA